MKFALLSFAACSLASHASAQQPLQPIDMFRLDYFMTAGAEDPVAWLDAEHYLVFDAGSADPRGPSNWKKVEAKSGVRFDYVDCGKLAKSLGLTGEAAAQLDDPGIWTWNDEHTRYVLDINGDLYAGGLDAAVVQLTKTPEVEEVGVRLEQPMPTRHPR